MNLRKRLHAADWPEPGTSTIFAHFEMLKGRRFLRRHPKLTTLSGPSFYRAFRINL